MRKTIAAIGLILLMVGCIPSLRPLYTEKDLVFEPALVGTWTAEDGKEVWTFEKSSDNGYRLIYSSNGKAANFDARLLRLGKTQFLDLFPEKMETGNDFSRAHFIPTHTFYRATIEGSFLRLWTLDPDKLKKKLDAGTLKLAHETSDDGLLLTASTEELQRFMLNVLDDADAFNEMYNGDGGLKRKK